MSSEPLTYAFGHLVASWYPDAHSADSGDLGSDVLDEMGLSPAEKALVERLAEHVAANYCWTGEGEAIMRRIEAGEL